MAKLDTVKAAAGIALSASASQGLAQSPLNLNDLNPTPIVRRLADAFLHQMAKPAIFGQEKSGASVQAGPTAPQDPRVAELTGARSGTGAAAKASTTQPASTQPATTQPCVTVKTAAEFEGAYLASSRKDVVTALAEDPARDPNKAFEALMKWAMVRHERYLKGDFTEEAFKAALEQKNVDVGLKVFDVNKLLDKRLAATATQPAAEKVQEVPPPPPPIQENLPPGRPTAPAAQPAPAFKPIPTVDISQIRVASSEGVKADLEAGVEYLKGVTQANTFTVLNQGGKDIWNGKISPFVINTQDGDLKDKDLIAKLHGLGVLGGQFIDFNRGKVVLSLVDRDGKAFYYETTLEPSSPNRFQKGYLYQNRPSEHERARTDLLKLLAKFVAEYGEPIGAAPAAPSAPQPAPAQRHAPRPAPRRVR